MDKIKEDETKKERKYVKNFTMGVIEDANIPIVQLKRLKKDNIKNLTTKDFGIIRQLANAAMIEGEPFTKDTLFEDIDDLTKFLSHFLGQSRLKSAKETLKQKRSPKV